MAALTGARLAAKLATGGDAEITAAALAARKVNGKSLGQDIILSRYDLPVTPCLLAELPPAADLPNGVLYRVTNYGGFNAEVVNGAWRFSRLYTTWAGLPNATVVPAGTEASVTNVAGAIAVAGAMGWTFRPIVINNPTKVTVTGVTTEQDCLTLTIPAGLLGLTGTVMVDADFSFTGSTNNKIMKAWLAGQDLWGGYTVNSAGAVAARRFGKTRIRDGNRQLFSPLWGLDGSTSILTQAVIDTSLVQTVRITTRLGLASETISLEGATITIQPGM